MSKIYIVTEGCYDDYKVTTVFDDLDLAIAFVESRTNYKAWLVDPKYVSGGSYNVWTYIGGSGFDTYNIEEYDLNVPSSQIYKNLVNKYLVNMFGDGSYSVVEMNPHVGYIKLQDNKLYGLLDALNAKHAAKIANEMRLHLIQEGLWDVQE